MARKKEPTYITENKPFPKALRQLMNDTNITQPILAEAIGVTRQTISLYSTGQSTPDIDVFLKIADYFNVSFEYLLGRSQAKTKENVDINERIGLSDKAINKLENWNEAINVKTPEGMMVEVIKNTKAPNELNKIIENDHFAALLYYIRSLKYINDEVPDLTLEQNMKNPILDKSTMNSLKSEIGKNETRGYIMFLIEKTFREIVEEIEPWSPIDEKRKATQADIDDLLGS